MKIKVRKTNELILLKCIITHYAILKIFEIKTE